MKIRIAKKIVKRFGLDPVVLLRGRTSRNQVEAAFRRLSLAVPHIPFPDPKPVPAPKVEKAPKLDLTGVSDKIKEDFSGLGVAALKAACKERGLTGYSSLRKGDLIALLEG